jgi:cell division protein FtsB
MSEIDHYPCREEVLRAEIERLRAENAELRAEMQKLYDNWARVVRDDEE